MTIAAQAGGESAGATGEVESRIARGASAGLTGGRSQALPEGAAVSRAGEGERRCDPGGERNNLREARGGVIRGVERRHHRRRRLQARPEKESANACAFPPGNTCTPLIR